MVGCVEIRQDLYDISKRLREIDRGYFAVYNSLKSRFEVHHRGQRNTFCLALPYETLDERTLRLVRRTRAERAEECMRELERENAIKEREIRYEIKKKAQKALEEAL